VLEPPDGLGNGGFLRRGFPRGGIGGFPEGDQPE